MRLYVAPMYGYKSIKWLDGIELTDKVDPGLLGAATATTSTGGSGRSNGRDDDAT